ncbi:MAG TPA: hypothetical protein VGG83_14600 [Trebonia sp.]
MLELDAVTERVAGVEATDAWDLTVRADELGHPEEPRVEGPRRVLASARHRQLDVIKSSDHRITSSIYLHMKIVDIKANRQD